MAATKRNAMWIEETRKKAQASQLINRLRDHVLGKVELSATQVTAAAILLRKCIPDLSSVEQTTEVNVNYVARIPQAQPALIEWQRSHDELKPAVN